MVGFVHLLSFEKRNSRFYLIGFLLLNVHRRNIFCAALKPETVYLWYLETIDLKQNKNYSTLVEKNK